MCCCVRSTDLGILLGMALGNEGLEVWPLTRSEECAITGFLRDKLQYRNRLQYMKHYFPINYRVSVPYEGVLRMANVTRLQRARVSQQELRYLWVLVSLSATEWVQEVLLEGHPSWKYLEEVHTLLLDVKQGLPPSLGPWYTTALGPHLLPSKNSQQEANCELLLTPGLRASTCFCSCRELCGGSPFWRGLPSSIFLGSVSGSVSSAELGRRLLPPFQGVEVSPQVEAVLSLLSAPGSLKPVRPKALLDNCLRVMELLYCSCCKEL
ncbi:hypothetical protein EI555_019844 [Monodon monoceros]|uniref:Interleukin-34 n=1 Tax=Monodon monoceros TaxID=40151 RepID=A0A4U1EGS9_MONMO|nr:hypothetical protein EI555_019844 [Monodon monoceros]